MWGDQETMWVHQGTLLLNGDLGYVLDLHDMVFFAELGEVVDSTDKESIRREGADEYVLCTTEMMSNGIIRWNKQAQKARWKSLAEKGYIKIRYYGLPRQRWICIDEKKLTADIKKAKNAR